MDKILEALGATDEAHALRIIAEFKSAATSLHALTGRESFALQLPVIQARCTFVSTVEAKTGKTGEEALGMLTAWKGSHETVELVQKELGETKGKLEKLETDGMFTSARAECKIDKAAEDDMRKEMSSGALTLVAAKTALKHMRPIQALVNAQTLQQPALLPPAVGSAGTAPVVDPSKKYEDYTAREMSDMRSDGTLDKNAYAALRQTWLRDGQPPVKTAAA